MDTSNAPNSWEINVKFLTAITALETMVANLVENVKKLDSRLDNHTSSDSNLRSEFNTFKAQQEMQLSQVLGILGETKRHIADHCAEIEKKADTAIAQEIKAILDRVILIEQNLAQKEIERKTREDTEKKQKEDEEKKRVVEMENFTKRNAKLMAFIAIVTILAMFAVVDYQSRKEKKNESHDRPSTQNNAQPINK